MARILTRLPYLTLASGAALTLTAVTLLGLARARPAHAQPLGAPSLRQAAVREGRFSPPAAMGTTFVVTTTSSLGAGSLRRAINDANASPGSDEIRFDLTGCPCVIQVLGTGFPAITEAVSIKGPGAGLLAVDGNHSFRVFSIDGAAASLSDLTVQNGSTAGQGAGIRSSGPLTLTDVVVLNNAAQGIGGGVYVSGAAHVTGGRFENNTSGEAGGGLAAYGAVTLTSAVFISNTAEGSGGGLRAFAGVHGSDVQFERNQSLNNVGGGLYSSDTLWLSESHFSGNRADSNGGGAYAYGAITLSGGEFAGNESLAGQGGALFAESTAAVLGTQFLSNTSGLEGGAVYLMGEAELEGVDFRANQSLDHDGGALYVYASATLTDTEFISNTATGSGYGGGLYAYEVRLTGGRFERNVGYEGGGIYASYLTLTNTDFISNTAVSHGGGAYGSETVVTGGAFVGNSAPTDAGGLGAGTLTLSGTAFISNTTTGNGGGVYGEGEAAIRRALFAGNQGGNGGGLYAGGALTLTASAFFDNHATDGGGLYHASGLGGVWNLLFVRNLATSGGAALHLKSAGSAQVAHVTVVGTLPVTGTGILADSSAITVTNSIVMRQAVGIGEQGGTVSQDYNLFYANGADTQGAVTGGANSLVGDPLFAGLGVGPANFHLGPGSPAIDQGTDAGVAVDFDGDPRPQDLGFDIGFDEASFITGLSIAYAPTPSTPLSTPTTLTATIASGSGVTYRWDFGDGTPFAVGNPVTHTYAAAGQYTASVTALNASGSVSATAQVTVSGATYLPLLFR